METNTNIGTITGAPASRGTGTIADAAGSNAPAAEASVDASAEVRRSTIRCIGLVSGGLDSSIATVHMKRLGFDVLGINFSTGFCSSDHLRMMGRTEKKTYRNEALRAGADFDVPIELIDVAEEYLGAVLAQPKHGFGQNMNPCVDCRIFMFGKARALLDEYGASFIYTGEVLGQRPMSQHRYALRTIEKESGLDGLVLRPLSGQLLPPTIPEKRGWLRRDELLAISGRSRKDQMRLAAEYGIDDYPQPAGGCCVLTDESYSRRLRDQLAFVDVRTLTREQCTLLKVGRHLRLPSGVKVIVGRDEKENDFLQERSGGRWTLQALDYPGPIVLAEAAVDGASLDEAALVTVAAITARYSDGKAAPEVTVWAGRGVESRELTVAPLDDTTIHSWLI
jgi:tRNA-uridine 2-sulfurtransferase